MILLGLKTIVEANIDIRHHMKLSVQELTKMIRFLEEDKLPYEGRKRVELSQYDIEVNNPLDAESAVDYYRGTTIFEEYENEVFMTEIQL
jgi:hypothetical protein